MFSLYMQFFCEVHYICNCMVYFCRSDNLQLFQDYTPLNIISLSFSVSFSVYFGFRSSVFMRNLSGSMASF